MDPQTKRTLRRKIGGFVLLVGALGLYAHFSSVESQIVDVTLVYRLGDPPAASRLEVRVLSGEEVVAQYRSERPQPRCRQKLHIRRGAYVLDIEARTAAEGLHRVKRPVTIDADGEIGIDLEVDLGMPAGQSG